MIEANGSPSFTAVGDHFFLYDGSGSGPSLKYGGMDAVAGQFGAWTPIGAEQTATGYEVAWKLWERRSVLGLEHRQQRQLPLVYSRVKSDYALQSLEPIFQQDLNSDGLIGPTTVLDGHPGAQTLTAGGGTTLIGGPTDILNAGAGAGNDAYVVDNAGDLIVENASEGSDTVYASINYTLPANTLDQSFAGPMASWKNVKDFGAIGDGITDDTAAIQAALNALKDTTNNPWSVLYFPAGTYRITQQLTTDRPRTTITSAQSSSERIRPPRKSCGMALLGERCCIGMRGTTRSAASRLTGIPTPTGALSVRVRSRPTAS